MSCEPEGHGEGHTCHCVDEEGAECHMFDFNLTNLHAHGSHVEPDFAPGGGCVESDGLKCRACAADRDDGPRECFHADDVLARAGPGEGLRHRWDLDADHEHHDGLNWYHPHIHGTTAIQVAAGASGALVVRGPVDEVPGIADARERIFVFKTPPEGYDGLEDGVPCDEDHITFDYFPTLSSPREKQFNLVNGLERPRMVMAPGQIERWRFVHAGFLDEVYMSLFRSDDPNCEQVRSDEGPIQLVQIARDGVTMPRPADGDGWPFAPQYFFMSPGYRIDMLLDGGQFEHGDTLCLFAGRFLQVDTSGDDDRIIGQGELPTVDDILRRITDGDLVAIVNVTDAAGPPTETEMPDLEAVAALAKSTMLQDGTLDALARCEEVAEIEDVDEIEQLSVLWALPAEVDGFDMCGCPDHNLNCENFEFTDRSRYPFDRTLVRGEVDHWRLQAGYDGHPFHIHVNPFLVCPLPLPGSGHPNAKSRLFEPPFAHWRDTYLVNLDRAVDMLTEYRAYTGAFVYHCHKLTHEDHGMMELIEICDPETDD
ncbi:MAG: multicopper oxidase domain-containing protein, partial [Phycisphaerales bacterium]|nr:multicopper oxidase domain-containing protein [Phycisphaerales bacterium]